MDPKSEKLLHENARLVKENNKLLKKLWRAEVFGFWSKLLFVAILIGVPVLIYQYYLADVLVDLRTMYEGIQQDIDQVRGLSDSFSLGAVIESMEEKRKELID